MNKINISVCLASYNGEAYIVDQIQSILDQLDLRDELIVVDDCSVDNTRSLVKAMGDNRIKLIKNKVNLGHVRSFELALAESKGDIIFLSDQDDIWLANKIDTFINELNNPKIGCVISNYYEWNSKANVKTIKIIKCITYFPTISNLFLIFTGNLGHLGCCMAFTRSQLNRSLPFPNNVDAHDRWLAISAFISAKVIIANKPTLLHRIHKSNLTPTSRRAFNTILLSRYQMINHLLIALFRRL